MFDDERITITCGKIFRKGILIATILSFLFIILKSFTFINFFSVETLFLNTGELCIFFVGIYILIVGEFNDQFGVEKDERYYSEKFQYYIKKSKLFLIVSLLGFAISIPFFIRFPESSSVPVNTLIILLEQIGFIFLTYEFRKNSINFNYTFIDDNNKLYYKKVFKNILKLFIMISIVYLVSIVIGILICFDIILSYLLATLLAYINSVLILSTIYFIISMIEKIMYNEEEKNTKYSKGLLFIFLTVIALTISSSIITTYFYLVSTGIKEGPELVVLVLKYNKIERYLKYYLIAFAGFGFASALTYINKDRNSKITVSILIFMLIMMACLNTVIPIINFIVVKNNEELVTMFMKTNLYIGFGLKIIFKVAMMMLLISISKFFNNKNLVLISGIMTFVLCIIGILLQMLQVQNWYLYSLSFNILEIIIISVFVVGLKVMNKPSALL